MLSQVLHAHQANFVSRLTEKVLARITYAFQEGQKIYEQIREEWVLSMSPV